MGGRWLFGFRYPTCDVNCPDFSLLTPSLCGVCLLLEAPASLGFRDPILSPLVSCPLSKRSFQIPFSPLSWQSWSSFCHLPSSLFFSQRPLPWLCNESAGDLKALGVSPGFPTSRQLASLSRMSRGPSRLRYSHPTSPLLQCSLNQ